MDMDIEELVQVEEAEVNFDFLDSTETEKQFEKTLWQKSDTLVLIAKSDGAVPPDFNLCGKSMIDWVKMASSGCQQKIIDCPNEDNVLDVCRSFCEGFEFVVLLFSDTPLLQKNTFVQIMEDFANSGKNAQRLERGYVFRSSYLKTAKMFLSTSVFSCDGEDFLIVDSANALSHAFSVQNSRILQYHKDLGVVIFGENTVFIDADVQIEAGAIIFANNILKGQTYVGKNVVLESGNQIVDTIICDGVRVVASFLQNCKVEKTKVVGPFEKLINQEI